MAVNEQLTIIKEKEFMRRENKIILIGYRCTGKTSIGKRLAGRLGVPFIDTDRLVEAATGKTIKALIETRSWAFFREKEREAIATLTSLEKSVIATGGGAVMDKENAAILKKEGLVIWLVADEDTILERMLADAATAEQRPPFSTDDLGKEIRDTLTIRTPVYSRLADFSVDTGLSGIDESVSKILHFLTERRG
ncbi:MAG TPA: shikimate kinase [Syntrophales bacterium]|nr:shikimate kinase [Syntrophales bacterium]